MRKDERVYRKVILIPFIKKNYLRYEQNRILPTNKVVTWQ